jgi:glutaredoxin
MNIKLYIKDGCPWCIQLEAFLTTNNIKYDRIDVTTDEKLFEEMKNISGQDKAPVIIIDGDMIADTDADQVKAHLISKGVVFENDAPALKGVCNI